MAIIVAAVASVLLMMFAEFRVSRRNERTLRARGAFEPPSDVHPVMAWVYPATFVGMGTEAAVGGLPDPAAIAAGAIVFAAGKALKYWAIASLGSRWTFRVLVLPGAPLVTRGAYRWLRHPNYVGVVGELLGAALMAGAVVTGPVSIAVFALLLRHRIATENRALGRDQAAKKRV